MVHMDESLLFCLILILILFFWSIFADDIGSDEHTHAARLAGESRATVESRLHSGLCLTAGL